MSLDFQSIRQQVKQLGETALIRERELRDRKARALELLDSYAQELPALRQKIGDAVRNHDPSLRCAMPVEEPLNFSAPLPPPPGEITVIAADGSQISPDRHAEVNFALVNVGAIQLRRGSPEPPETSITSQLIYDEQLYSSTGTISDASLALKRDLNERLILGQLAAGAQPPVAAITDGPMELWGGQSGDSAARTDFEESLRRYLEALTRLYEVEAITAGYVDKPAANLVVRTLEVAMTPEAELANIKDMHPLRGVSDIALFRERLKAGERSAVMAIQSQSAKKYAGPLQLFFFYLNAGTPGRPYLARVEIPGWVAGNPDRLDILQAVLIEQCRVMGARPYPYLLHRAHETAVVKMQDKEQVSSMISQELRQRGIAVGELSAKQSAKQVPGRARYER
jgi:hypothetical protein